MLVSLIAHETIFLVFIKTLLFGGVNIFAFLLAYFQQLLLSFYGLMNIYIEIHGKCIYLRYFSKKRLNLVKQLFGLEGKLKNWKSIKNEYHLLESKIFHWMQSVDALETRWKQSTREQNTNLNSLIIFDHYLTENKFFLLVNLMTKNYNILILCNYKKPTLQGYFEAFFESSTIDWKDIYLLARKTAMNTKHGSFQYKILNRSSI